MSSPLFAASRRAGNKCWTWVGSRNEKGYGRVWHDGRNQRAHRVAWELAHGPIPDDMTVDHVCKNRACVNPRHLRLLSWDENCGPTRWGREWWLWRGRALKLQLQQWHEKQMAQIAAQPRGEF